MSSTVLGIFFERNNAEKAVRTLNEEGYNPKDMSIIMKDVDEGREMAEDIGTNILEGTTAGATAGAVLGGFGGLLASYVILGLGAFFIGGPIAVALGLTGTVAATTSGAVTGALAGGLLGALTGFGLSEDEAKDYETRIREGGILLAVSSMSGEEGQIEQILKENDADQVKSVKAEEDIEERLTADYDFDDNVGTYSPLYATVGTKGGKATRKAKIKKVKGKRRIL